MSTKDEEMEPKEKNSYELKLKALECPFTWSMDNIIGKDVDVDYHPHDDEDSFPLLKLMRDIMSAYVSTQHSEERKTILEFLKNCDQHMIDLKKKANPEISIKAARYVLQATKCYIFRDLDMIDELKSGLQKIEDITKMSNKDISTLKACRSIAWSKYHRFGADIAVNFIRRAIKKNPNCDMWYFILGKNLRRKRRDMAISSPPTKEECESFLKAYQMSKNPVYGIFVAQMYRESQKRNKALRIYEDVFRTEPESITVILRMALGFTQLRSFALAKKCLDEAAERCPTHSMYLHYHAIFYLKQNKFAEALVYLEEAIRDSNNLPAEKQYLQCKMKLDKTFKVTEYLLKLLEKYNTWPEQQKQPIILDIAFSFWKKDKNIKQALKYFLLAIELGPKAKCMTNYYSGVEHVKDKNVFLMLKRDLLPLVYQRPSEFGEENMKIADILTKHCNKYYNEQFQSTHEAFSKFKLRNKSK